MNTSFPKTASLCLLIAIGLALHPARSQAQNTIIYADSFPGSSANPLNGTAPGTSSGTLGGSASATWSARNNFHADGSVTSVGSGFAASAVLPFTPWANQVYILSATVNAVAGVNHDWIALGFAQTNNTSAAFDNTNGAAWMLQSTTHGAGQGQTLRGPGASGISVFDDPGGPLNFRIVLNTTSSLWTVQFFLNGSALGGPTAYATNPTINFVGFSMLGTATGTIQNFSLTAVPESGSSLVLLALALLPLVSYSRRVSKLPPCTVK